MSYDTLRRSAVPHGITVVLAVACVVVGVTAAGAMTAVRKDAATGGRYQLDYSMNLGPGKQIMTRLRLVDTETKETIGEPRVTTQAGVPAQITFDSIIRDAGFAWRRTDEGIGVFKP